MNQKFYTSVELIIANRSLWLGNAEFISAILCFMKKKKCESSINLTNSPIILDLNLKKIGIFRRFLAVERIRLTFAELIRDHTHI